MSKFVIYPAIDLRQGQVVRLKQGDPTRQTIFSHSPVEIAQKWHAAGATWVHVVNLDGAFQENDEQNQIAILAILRYAQTNKLRIQIGGGIRSLNAVTAYLDLGVERIIFGTAAISDPVLITGALQKFGPEKIVVGVDAKEGYVYISGWQEKTRIALTPFVDNLCQIGVKTIIFTDIHRDGIGTGINLRLTSQIGKDRTLNVIASGGVKDIQDVIQVKEAGLSGIIVGRALYDQSINASDLFQLQKVK